MTSPTPTLIRIVSLRVLLFGLLAMLIQVIFVSASYWQDDQGLARSLVKLESDQLASGLVHDKDGGVRFVLSPALAERYEPFELQKDPAAEARYDADLADGYYARIRTRDGAVLFTNCGDDCTDHLLPLTVNPPSFWERLIRPGKPLFFAGGRTIDVGGEIIHIELAVIRDPEFRVAGVLAEELKDHMVVPMTLMLTLVIGATIWSIATALRPVATAAAAAERIDPSSKAARIRTDGMPLEIARFATAVNRGIDRVGELMRSQKLFTSAIAHEIRTPAAIIRMELERIDHPAARKALADLESLTHILEQLTALARLEAVDPTAYAGVDLARLGEETVAAMAPFVYENGRSIAFVDNGATAVPGVSSLVENLVRNLVENAVRHTPRGTAITVSAGPGPMLTVSDDGPGFGQTRRDVIPGTGTVSSGGSLGIGLKIVERIAALHGAEILRPETGRGATVVVRFPEVWPKEVPPRPSHPAAGNLLPRGEKA